MKLKSIFIITLTCVLVVGGYTYKYVGCYNDNPISRALSGSMFFNYDGNSIPYCVSQCAQQVESTTQDASTTQGSVPTAAGSASTTQGSVPTAAGSTPTTQVSDGSTQTKLADPSTSTAASETATNHAETMMSNDGLSIDGTTSLDRTQTIGIVVGAVAGAIIGLAVVLRLRKFRWYQKSRNNRTSVAGSGHPVAGSAAPVASSADASKSNIEQDSKNKNYQTNTDNQISKR